MSDVTRDDLRDLRDTIVDEMRAGFRGVHERQDVTNGRISKAEADLGRLDVRAKNLEREVFDRHRPDAPTPLPVEPSPAARDRRITERDVRMLLAGASAVVAIVTLLWKVLPFLHRAL